MKSAILALLDRMGKMYWLDPYRYPRLWIENTEGAKFWMKVFNDLKTRGVQDVLIAVTDGLQGMEQALGAVFPQTTLQTCIVNLIRSSLDYANWKDCKALAAALKLGTQD